MQDHPGYLSTSPLGPTTSGERNVFMVMGVTAASLIASGLLVLDEPTSGIDPEGRATVWDVIRAQSAAGCAVLATTHDMAEAEAFCDDLLVMARGRIRLRGSVEQVLAALDGDRRLRVMSPTSEVTSLVRASGRPWGRSGESLVVVGSAAQVDDLARAIERLPGTRGLEVRHGPVRLEDVFAIVAVADTARPAAGLASSGSHTSRQEVA